MSAKPHFCLDCRKLVQAVWGADAKRHLCAGLACPDCGSQKIEDMIIERRELLDCTAELHQRIAALEAENKALNEQVNALIGRCKELAAEIMPVRERAESAEASFKERDLQMRAALEETESMFQRCQRAETENTELRERLKVMKKSNP